MDPASRYKKAIAAASEELPAFVARTYALLDSDADGEPGVWVWVLIKDDAPPSAWTAASLEEIRDKLQLTLENADLTDRWLFVRFAAESDEEKAKAALT